MNTVKDFVLSYLISSKDTMTLREAAQATGLHVGAAIGYPHATRDQAYAKMATAEYSLLTAENACKMNSIARTAADPATYDFTDCDYLYTFAKDGDMVFRGHNTCWANVGQPYYQPDFIRNETDSTKIEKFLNDYIHAVVGRYEGKAAAWDIVNEAIDDDPKKNIRDSVFNKVDDFICKAFKWAKEADHSGEMYYNDYNHASATGWQKSKSDKVYNLVKDLHDRGCGIDGVGF